jgi:peptide/nickel transport system permease protein
MTSIGPVDPTQAAALDPAAELLAEHDAGQVYEQGSSWRLAWQTFRENRFALVGIALVIFFILFSFVGPHLYHSNQLSGNIGDANLSPGKGRPLGIDENGFDELGRIMKGGQTALEIGFAAALLASVIGTLVGAIAGLAGGLVDATLMRIVDVGLAIPTLFIILVLAVRYNGTITAFIIIIGINSWFVPARLVRGEVLSLRTRDFVQASRSMGASQWRLMWRHLVPNALGTVIVNVTFQIADAVLFLSTVGYLGYGLNPPYVDWGDQLSDGVTNLLNGYWWEIYPVGACLILLVMAFNFIGDGLRDALDVRLRRR